MQLEASTASNAGQASRLPCVAREREVRSGVGFADQTGETPALTSGRWPGSYRFEFSSAMARTKTTSDLAAPSLLPKSGQERGLQAASPPQLPGACLFRNLHAPVPP